MKGRKWDNCNSIINKYIKKKKKRSESSPSAHQQMSELKSCGTFIPWNTTYTAIKKEDLLPSAPAWMDLEIIKLNEISQSEKDKYQMISLTRGI